jgi:hypothetical protein
MHLLVMSVMEWEMDKDDDGKKLDTPIKGAQLTGLKPDDFLNPKPCHRDDRGMWIGGTKSLKYSLSRAALDNLPPSLPCVCECVLDVVSVAGGKAGLQVASIHPVSHAVFDKLFAKAAKAA